MLERVLSGLADLAFPRRCAGCRSYLDDYGAGSICECCATALEPLEDPRCPRCGKPLATLIGEGQETEPEGPCAQCRELEPPFDRAYAAYLYTGLARDLILACKYGRQPALARVLADLVLSRRRELGLDHLSGWGAVPVPIHRARLRERGFNQAGQLAGRLARELGMRNLPDLLERRSWSSAQADLDYSGRLRNIGDSIVFRGRAKAEGCDLVVIDDVLTTGATASACAAALLGAGARRVEVLTVARAVDWSVMTS